MHHYLLAFFAVVPGSQAALAADPDPGPVQSVSVSASAASAESEVPRFQCHQESDIGSMRMHKVCTKVLTDNERLATQKAMTDLLPNNSLTHPAIGDPTYRLMGQPGRH